MDEAAVGAEGELGILEVGVEIALIGVVRAEELVVGGEGLAVEDAAGSLGDQAQVPADAGVHVGPQILVVDRLVTYEGDAADDDLARLVDDQVDVDLAGLALDRADRVVDVGEEEAALDVDALDLLDVGLDHPEVEDRVLGQVEDLVDVVEFDLAVALDDDLPDRRPLPDPVGEDDARGAELAVDGDVVELAEPPEALEIGGERGGLDQLPGLRLDLEEHRLGLDPAVALEANLGDRLAVEVGVDLFEDQGLEDRVAGELRDVARLGRLDLTEAEPKGEYGQ